MSLRRLTGSLVLALLAPSGPPLAQSGWRDSADVRALYEKARAEGEVVIWGAQDRELDWIAEPFARRFPGVVVKWTADRSANTKIVAEYRARRYAADVFHYSLGGMIPLQDRGLLGKNDWSAWGSGRDPALMAGTVGATHNLVYSVVYNERLVAPADLPKTWDDLLEPGWKGKLVASQFLLPRLLGFLALEWGEEKTMAFARALLDRQQMLVTRAPREDLLQRGERLIGVGEFIGSALYWKSRGMPIGWVAMPILPAAQFGVAVLARPPHPHAAKLLAGWLVTDEAKAARERLRFDADVRPGATTNLAGILTRSGGRLVFEDVSNMKQRAANYEKFAAIVVGRDR
jgi:ABC-type Fe3+ transport system substrate-binding protein